MNTHKRIVLKFGGSVLNSSADFARIKTEISHHINQGYQVVAVVSAYYGVTETLIKEAECKRLSNASVEYADLVARGEFQSAHDLSHYLAQHGFKVSCRTPSAFSFLAQGSRTAASPTSINPEKITLALDETPVVIMPGFSAIDHNGHCILLGRGGSDISAVYIAQALKLECVRLLKDVDGLYDKDPNKHEDAERLPHVDYQTARRIGGELIQTEAIDFAASKHICIDVAAIGETNASRIGPTRDAPANVVQNTIIGAAIE